MSLVSASFVVTSPVATRDSDADTGLPSTLMENPFRVGLETERTPAPCVFVIFGASGDLTRRKLIPALYNLAVSRLLPPGMSIVGFALTELTEEAVPPSRCARRVARVLAPQAHRRGGLGRLRQPPALRVGQVRGPGELRAACARSSRSSTHATGRAATASTTWPSRRASSAPSTTTSRRPGSWPIRGRRAATRASSSRSPSGATSRAPTRSTPSCTASSHEQQIFRIDHYLGKETVQNLVALRFGNAIFEPLWNRNHIDHVQITVAEDIGVEGRGKFYEEAGATRDIVQNHLLQLLMVTAMEPPVAFTADEVRDEKVKVLRALKPIVGDDVDDAHGARAVRARATSPASPCPGYRRSRTSARRRTSRRSSRCSSRSTTGASPACRSTSAPASASPSASPRSASTSSDVPHALLSIAAAAGSHVEPDVLAIRIQPDEGIALRFVAKVPGPTMTLRPVTMDFRYGSTFGGSGPEAYERLILDAMLGDPTLFARADEVSAAWRFITPILEAWEPSRRRSSRTTRRDLGAARRRSTSSSATGARGGGYEAVARQGRAGARAALGRGGAIAAERRASSSSRSSRS